MLPLKDKYDVDKTDTSDTLKDNVPEAIGEIQLHTIGYVPKNWASLGS